MRSNKTKLTGLITLCIITLLLVPPARADEEYHVIATMQAPTLTDSGGFGSDLALYEDILLIAEDNADLGDLDKVGKAYIFDSDWNLVTTLQAPSPLAYETFSYSIDVWGDTIAISSMTSVEDIENAGKVYIFDSEGVLLTTIQSPEPEIMAAFGCKLCLYRDILLVTECLKDDQGFVDAGVVHIFDSEGDFLRTIHSPSPINGGLLGCSIDANDEFILVGESGDWTSRPIDNGSVYVYNREYELVETLHSPDHQERTYFGIPVAINGDHIVVGEHHASVDGHERAGRAHIYDTDWNLVATLQSPTPEDNGEFGMDVDIGGGLVVVGERKGDVVTMNEGKAYVFDLEGNLIDTLVSPEPEIGAQFGWRVVTDGEIIVVADVFHSVDGVSKAGTVHIFGKGTANSVTNFIVNDLTIDPDIVKKGETVTLSVECGNTGTISGVYQVVLTINGAFEDEKTVTIGPDETTSVSLEVTAGEAGEYSVDVNGLSGSFNVEKAQTGIPGFPFESIVISMVLAVLVLRLIQRQR